MPIFTSPPFTVYKKTSGKDANYIYISRPMVPPWWWTIHGILGTPAITRHQTLHQRNFHKIWALYPSPILTKVRLKFYTHSPTLCAKPFSTPSLYTNILRNSLYNIRNLQENSGVWHQNSAWYLSGVTHNPWWQFFTHFEKMHFSIQNCTMDISSLVRRINLVFCRNNSPYASVYV